MAEENFNSKEKLYKKQDFWFMFEVHILQKYHAKRRSSRQTCLRYFQKVPR